MARDHGVRSVDVRVSGPGSGRESAVRALAVGGHRSAFHQGHDADSAQRLPSAEAPQSVRSQVASSRCQFNEPDDYENFRRLTIFSSGTKGEAKPVNRSSKKENNLARYTDAVCRLCRREGIKLFLKGTKCFSDKCPIEKRNFAPGQHGKDKKTKVVGYGLQLREKQKAKRIYFTQEGQFRNYFENAAAPRE